MNLIALLSWWQEDPSWLSDTVRSLALADVDGLVAVDGSYPHVPGATAMSEPEQATTISAAAADVGIVPVVVTRPDLWESECAKRTFMFRESERLHPDWLLVIDADERIIRAPADLKDRLAATDRDYADVCSLEQAAPVLGAGMEDDAMPTVMASRWVKPRRCLIRAVPGLTCGPAHYNYRAPDGRDLWGDEYGHPLTIRDLMIDHRNAHRTPERMQASLDYYRVRDELGVERHRDKRHGPASAEKIAKTNALLAAVLEEAS